MIAREENQAFKRIRDLEQELDSLLPWTERLPQPTTEMLTAEHAWQEAVWATAEAAGPYPLAEETTESCLQLAQQPVFVCGVHRSGTTLVRDLLDDHSQLSVLPSEGTYLTTHRAKIEAQALGQRPGFYGRSWLERLVRPIHQPPYWTLGRTTEGYSPYVDFVRRFLALWPLLEARLGRKMVLWPFLAIVLAYALSRERVLARLRWWVEKTPTNEAYLGLLRRDFPAARVLHVVRDPFAVYASRKRDEEQVFGTFPSPHGVLREMARSYRIAAEQARQADESTYFLLRYEDLLDDPETEMRKVARYLAIDWDDGLLRPTSSGIPTHSNSSFSADLPAGVIVRSTAGSRQLTQQEREVIAACTGDSARELGYPVESVRPLRKLAVQTHAWMIRASAVGHSIMDRAMKSGRARYQRLP